MRSHLYLITFLLAAVFFGQNAASQQASFVDNRDGKEYLTVTIGSQTWMAENLAFNPGEGAWAYGDNNDNIAVYGYLYNWETATKVCPAGWHLPSADEWKAFVEFLGGQQVAGGKLREVGAAHWKNRSGKGNNYGASDEFGYTALPGGVYGEFATGKEAEYIYLGQTGFWWSSSDIYGRYAWYWTVGETETGIGYDYFLKHYRLSVRCIKD